MSVYNKGVRLEREVIKIFKDNGFNALRSAGSHSPYDVVIWKETEENKKICFVAFVQCKVKKLQKLQSLREPSENTQQPDSSESASKPLQSSEECSNL